MRHVIIAAAIIAMCAGSAQAKSESAADLGLYRTVRSTVYSGLAGLELHDPCGREPTEDTSKNTMECSIAIGKGALAMITFGSWDIAIGRCSGSNIRGGSHNLLIGNFTSTPMPDTSWFANIDNRICWWRKTGDSVPCPRPVTPAECNASEK